MSFDESVGIDVKSPLAKTITVSKAERAGYKVANPDYVSQRPVDMPNTLIFSMIQRKFIPINV